MLNDGWVHFHWSSTFFSSWVLYTESDIYMYRNIIVNNKIKMNIQKKVNLKKIIINRYVEDSWGDG